MMKLFRKVSNEKEANRKVTTGKHVNLRMMKVLLMSAICVFMLMQQVPVLATAETAAAADPNKMVTSFWNLLAGLVQAVGAIITLISVVQVGIAIKGHDDSQRASAILGILGGIIILCAPSIVMTMLS